MDRHGNMRDTVMDRHGNMRDTVMKDRHGNNNSSMPTLELSHKIHGEMVSLRRQFFIRLSNFLYFM